MTPISIRQERAEEVITMIARFITLSRRRKAEEGGAGTPGRPSDKTVTTRSGSRIIIKPYEDTSGLVFGG